MATYNDHYRRGKRQAAKKMTGEQRRKLNEARRQIYKQDALPHNFCLCRSCARCFQGTCIFDGTENPAKQECEHYARKQRQYR